VVKLVGAEAIGDDQARPHSDQPTGMRVGDRRLEVMIAHHQGAISQSETVKANGSDADMLLLPDEIITAQQAEIAEVQSLLDG
jgi:uncharacterized protein (DUF305 family)